MIKAGSLMGKQLFPKQHDAGSTPARPAKMSHLTRAIYKDMFSLRHTASLLSFLQRSIDNIHHEYIMRKHHNE